MRKRILFMDNYAPILDTYANVLENIGYQILKAYSLDQARALLNDQSVHLAIFDMRMNAEEDDKDISGLLLAQAKEYSRLPKIIFTAYPDNYDYVRQALGVNADGTQPAVNFLAKTEGSKALIEAVSRAFEQHVRINWDLTVIYDERSPVTFPQIVSAVLPNATSELLTERADEMEGLFRALFPREDAIRIERVLWQRGGRVAVTVFPFAEGRVLESLVVVCGPHERIAEEAARYDKFAPKAHASTLLVNTRETLHFGANSYALADTDVDRVTALGGVWHLGPDKAFGNALDTLFEMTLVEWSKGRRMADEEGRTLDEVYRERLRLTPGGGVNTEQLRGLVEAIARWTPALGCTVEAEGEKLTFSFGGQSFAYANPAPYAERQTKLGQPVLLTYTPGTLTGENILADANGHTWLTDFAEAGLAPLLWDFVSLEAAVRFDWVEPCKLLWLHDMERGLVGDGFGMLDLSDVEQPLRRTVRTIRMIRRLASRVIGKDVLPYHLGILYHALRRLADINPALPHKPREVTRYAHVLMSAAMIARRLEAAGARSSESGVRIDKEKRVWVDGARVDLRGRSYEILEGLYQNAGRLCTRRQILLEFLGEKEYDETDVTQVNRLNTAISRLRVKIEADPERPRFIHTESGGYRLTPDGED